MNKVWVRAGLLSVGLTLFGAGSAQQTMDVAEVKQAALETVRAIQRISPSPIVSHWPEGNKCNVSAQNLYAGEPFLVRSLIRPTEDDLARLRRRVEAARREDPDFIGDARGEVRAARLNYQDHYEVPVYHRTCGYMFHVQPGDEKDGELGWGAFTPISAERAQTLLGVAKLPVFVNFYTSLTFLRDGQLWVSGSRAVNAFYPSKRYRIVNRAGKPVAPLETKLTPLIFRESFVTTGGESSAYWHFQLPVKLEPLPPPN